MSTEWYVLISLPDGSHIIRMDNIKEPRKLFHQYSVGEQVLAGCPGISRLCWGIIEGIDEHKDALQRKLEDHRRLLKKLKEEPRVHSLLRPTPKKSRKNFPKWIPENILKRYLGDPTVRFGLLGDAEASGTPLAADSLFKRRRTVDDASSYCGVPLPSQLPRGLGGPPSRFQAPAAPGASQDRDGSPSRRKEQDVGDYIAVAMKQKAGDILAQCQQQVYITSSDDVQSKDSLSSETDGYEVLQKSFRHREGQREEKMNQLEMMVSELQREVMSLKRKVQHLEATPLLEEPHPCQMAELFNGHTREQLREAIRFDQKISTACKTLLHKLFSVEYIQSHSITGRRGNTFRQAKPMMDERCVKVLRVLLKHKFGEHLTDTVITEKIQNVQKALRQKFKTESA